LLTNAAFYFFLFIFSVLHAHVLSTKTRTVPDPYYGGADGFEKVLDLLEDACEGLLASM
jgi:protein-tyrosine-phosphatase